MALYSDVQAALRSGDHSRVESLLAPVLDQLQCDFPTAAVSLEVSGTPAAATIRVHVQGGPSAYSYTSLISDHLGCSTNYQDDITGGEVYGWSGVYLTLKLVRSLPPVTFGLALLASSLAGPCEECHIYSYPEAPQSVFLESLRLDQAHLVETHPGLATLTHWGVSPEEVLALGELLGALRTPGGDHHLEYRQYLALFHQHGHVPGLREMNRLLQA